jgi:beta-galactosidase
MSIKELKKYADSVRNKPLILTEYPYSLGNGEGNLKDYWDVIETGKYLQGGFICNWADQGISKDANRCAQSLVKPDRTPQPFLNEVKKVYQYIKFKAVDITKGQFEIKNIYNFINLKEYRIKWDITADGKEIFSGIDSLDLAPNGSKIITIDFPKINFIPNTEYLINFYAEEKKAKPLIPENFVVAWEQFLITRRK